jgi:hypothetical protein
MMLRRHRYKSGTWLVASSVVVSLFGISPLMVPPALAQAGLGVVLDLPRHMTVGQAGLPGSLAISNANTPPLDGAANGVVDITLIPSCEAPSPGRGCIPESGDPGVWAVDSPAIGRAGTACAGVAFTVAVRDPATGQVLFDPPAGAVMLGPREQCVIDFTFTMTALPPVDALPGTGGVVWSTTHAGAHVLESTGGPAAAGTWRTWEGAH